MIARKTAALIECAAALGAWAAGASDAEIEAAGHFGFELGIAFQFQDDLLGVWGDPNVTGKPARDDVRSRKKALPMMLALELAQASTREEILTVLRAPDAPDETAVERVVTLMEQIGVREQAAEMVQAGFGRVEQAVEMALPAGQDGPIRELLARLRVRDY
jgi:geranylgeranyl diphosphate synthase type I